MANYTSTDFIDSLKHEFESNANPHIAENQQAYVRNKFQYYGLTTTIRRAIQRPFLIKEFLPPKKELFVLTQELWQKEQREYQYFAQELVLKYAKQVQKQDIAIYEYMVINKSWWETVDFIAVKLMGNYFKTFPELKEMYIDKWLKSNNIWLQRSALLFQLKYKEGLDTQLLSKCIVSLLGSKEFFINKAIGWVLREYSRTNPEWVVNFTQKKALNPLSKREALRLIK